MAFEEYEPRGFKVDPIPEGQASIDKHGTLRIRKADLGLVGITDCVTILTDELTMRLALRKPRSERKTLAVHNICRTKKNPDPHWGRVAIGGAIKSIRLDPEAVAGRYELTTKEDLIIIALTDTEDGEEEADSRPEKKRLRQK